MLRRRRGKPAKLVNLSGKKDPGFFPNSGKCNFTEGANQVTGESLRSITEDAKLFCVLFL